jgi:hypothetical protein
MRRIAAPAVLALVAAACGGSAPAAVTPTTSPPPVSVPVTLPPTEPPATVTPVPSLPAGVPTAYPGDVASGDVPLEALIPKGARAEGSWYASLPSGDAIVVAYADRSDDPFRAARGLVVWRRLDADPPWRAVFGLSHPADEGVLGIDAIVADVTGDGSPDALVEESTGGSGACGNWRVIDLAEAAQVWERPELCDAQVVPSAVPVGLSLTQAVYAPGDSHCCPSAMRTTVYVYGPGGWTVAKKKVTPTG